MHNPPLVFNVSADPTETTPVTLGDAELEKLVQIWCEDEKGPGRAYNHVRAGLFNNNFRKLYMHRKAEMDDIASSFQTISVRGCGWLGRSGGWTFFCLT